MTRRQRIGLKAVVWAGCLTPLAALAWRLLTDPLVTNPIDVATDTLGDWTLRILLLSLSMTPLRILFGLSWPVTLRRLLGLFAFSYAVLHFSVWIVIDHFFDWPTMVADVVKRPYVTVGFTALLLLVPLALTSTAGMVRRLGALAWRRLHRLVYLTAILGVLHYLWLAKVGVLGPYYYAAWLVDALHHPGCRRRAPHPGACSPARLRARTDPPPGAPRLTDRRRSRRPAPPGRIAPRSPGPANPPGARGAAHGRPRRRRDDQPQVRSRGSIASRTASPKRFSPKTDTAIAAPGKIASQGAFRMFFCAS